MTTRTPVSSCPACGKIIDALSRPVDDDATPSPGDVTVCLYCAAVLIINTDLTVRSPLQGEMDRLETDMDLKKLQEIIQMLNAKEAARRSIPRTRFKPPRDRSRRRR